MWFRGSTLMTSPQNNTWITLSVFLGSLFFALSARRRVRGTLVLCQYSTASNNSPTGTLSKAIRKPICMLPMLDLVYASNRAFKMVSIMFCVGRLILLAQMHTNHTVSWLEGKIKRIMIFFSFLVVQHSGRLLHAAALGMECHGSSGTMVAAMVSGCMV
jgi:hypothetical protein